MNVDELITLITVYELATFTLSTSLERLHHIIAAGIDVHPATYTKCIERIETVKSVLPDLQGLFGRAKSSEGESNMNKVWRFIVRPWQRLVSDGGLSEEERRAAKEEGERRAHLMIFILAATRVIRHDVLDVVEIDRNEIADAADNIEKHTMELANRVFGADIDWWKAELEKKQNREIGKYE